MLLQAAFVMSASFSHAALRQACVTAVRQQPEARAAVSAAADAQNRRLVGRRLGGRVSRKLAVADPPETETYMHGFTRGDVWATCDLIVEGILMVRMHTKGSLLGPKKGDPTQLLVKFEHRADTGIAVSFGVNPNDLTSSEPPLPGGFTRGDVWTTCDFVIDGILMLKMHSKGAVLGPYRNAPSTKLSVKFEHRADTGEAVHLFLDPNSLTSSEPPLPATPDLAYGMQLKLQHKGTGCRLHSHDFGCPGGSKQQQVTGFYGEDDNDWWRIKAAHGEAEPLAGTHVEDGDVIRLQHVATGRNLHSHSIASPVTNQQEVSAFGTGGGDANCNWRVRLGQDDHGAIRLQHVDDWHGGHGYLHSHRRMLPCYGQGQGQSEVTVYGRTVFGRKNRDDLWCVQRLRMPEPLVEVAPLAAPTGIERAWRRRLFDGLLYPGWLFDTLDGLLDDLLGPV